MPKISYVEALAILPWAWAVLCLVQDIYALVPNPVFLRRFQSWLATPFRTFLVISELPDQETFIQRQLVEWKHRMLLMFTAALATFWLCFSSYNFAIDPKLALAPGLVGLSWVYSAARLMARPTITPPYKLLIFAFLSTWSVLFTFWQTLVLARLINVISLGQICFLSVSYATILAIGLSMPINSVIPGKHVANPSSESSDAFTSAEDDTTLWTWMTFSWFNPVISKGAKQDLDKQDVWRMSPLMSTEVLFRRFRETRKARSLLRHILASNSLDTFLDLSLTAVSVLLDYAGPVFMKLILERLALPTAQSRTEAIGLALILFGIGMTDAEVSLMHLFFARRAGFRCRSELIATIHDKALRRKDMAGSLGQSKDKEDGADKEDEEEDLTKDFASVGKIQNLMSNDATRIAEEFLGVYVLVRTPLELFLAVFLLYTLLGAAALVGLAIMVVLMPITGYISKQSMGVTERWRALEDDRNDLVNNLLQAIRFIKSFGWEEHYTAKITQVREKELGAMIKYRLLMWFIHLLTLCTGPIVVISSFFVYTRLGHSLDVPTAFTSIVLFQKLKSPISWLPQIFAGLAQSWVAVKRIASFLEEPDVQPWACSLTRLSMDEIVHAPFIRNGTFRWQQRSNSKKASVETPFELKDINIEFQAGKMYLITGETASGKSSLLSALLGEMDCLQGEVSLNKSLGNVALCMQSAWLTCASIRDNITFQTPYNEERYSAVLEACALKQDLKLFEDGDRTQIGERGITLSGGTKYRVALARMAYSQAKVVLLDDPLAAVDAQTARHLFDKLLCGPLLKGRTILLVSHQVDLCSTRADFVLKMEDGRISSCDAFSRTAKEEDKSEEGVPTQETDVIGTSDDGLSEKKVAKVLIDEETKITGSVPISAYKRYIQAVPILLWFAIVFLSFSTQIINFGETLWLKHWGESSRTTSDNPLIDVRPASYYIKYYILLNLLWAVFELTQLGFFYAAALSASRVFFKAALKAVQRAPTRYFDKTPIGRILNRFSRDIDTIDSDLVYTVSSTAECVFSAIASSLILAYITPWLILPGLATIWLYYMIGSKYIRTSRDVRRMASNAASPLFSAFGELLHGVVTVRAFGAENSFESAMFAKTDDYQRMDWAFWMANRYLLFRCQLIGSTMVFLASSFSIAFASQGFAAIAMLNADALVEALFWLTRMVAYLEQEMNSVERLDELIKTESEKPAHIEGKEVPAFWPSDGAIEVKNLTLRYAPDLPVVLNASFDVKPRETIGIVGRTGSGKSTFAMGLLRFIEADAGSIVIDGIDISTIGLHDLRSRITVLGQDAVLSKGSLRDALDPLNLYSDEEIWTALDQVQMSRRSMSAKTSALPSRVASPIDNQRSADSDQQSQDSSLTCVEEGIKQGITSLDMEVAENGANFSAGQKQLLALARALLRRSKVLLLDEASASIDFATDQKLQHVIKDEFADAIVFIIAHRLKTVIMTDRVIVFGEGKVLEAGSPKDLFAGDGHFKALCLESSDKADLAQSLGVDLD